jgi:spoIIIJ-associated protein
MNNVEAEGSSIDEAIERALQQLGVTRDKVDVDILANATRGLFGLGSKPARVRATLRSLNLDGARAHPSAAPASRPAPISESAAPTTRHHAPKPESAPRPAPTPRPARAAEPVGEVDAQTLERARTMLGELMTLIGVEATVEAVNDDLGPRLLINGDTSGVLIGRRGQTLDAIEYIANRMVAREDESAGRIVVDSQNYRDRRRQSLEELAHRLAERARRRGKTVTLNPMSPRDRRIVHLALQNERALTTRSAGKGYFRKLLIIPEGDRGGERRTRRPPREG